ncbi:hypothetical protein IEE86_16115 [Bacillus sp. 28A-2]|uniref:hypothetical protein n=1 Tax=Bacillus sp. 28A-2 TaxID=2772252 RepID=UPI00168D5774|nr:hypothetical protein [Bacillus sp. 28A-2]MBD3861252.1 hypothetical protein [Bacillus sp. 28A-2]
MNSTLMKNRINTNAIKEALKGKSRENWIVYTAGSIMEGFGNENSDVDVYIICDLGAISNEFAGGYKEGEISIIEENTIVYNTIIGDTRYDFEYWDWKEVNKIVEKLNNFNFGTDQYKDRLSKSEIDFIHRLKYGNPVINKNSFASFIKNIVFDNLGYIQVIVHSEQYDGYLEDIEGALLSNDFGTSYVISKLLLETSVTSFLSVHGETNPSRKWLYRKLERFQNNNNNEINLLKKYLTLDSYCFDERNIESHIETVIEFCQELNLKTQYIIGKKQIISRGE